jgi:hypothetical protein
MGPCIKRWQATIIAAISEKADMTGGESPTSNVAQCRQVSNHLEKYLLQSEWDIFMSTTVSHEKKLLAMGQFFLSGCFCSTRQSQRLLLLLRLPFVQMGRTQWTLCWQSSAA